MADAAAKAYLNQPHNPSTAAAFLMDICEDIIIIQDSRTGDIRDRWLYREAKRMGHHWITQGTLLKPSPQPKPTTHTQRKEQQTDRKVLIPWLAILTGTTASSTAHTEKTVTTGPKPTYP